MAAFSTSSSLEELPPQHQVFINFRGEDTRLGFVSHLVRALQMNNINVYMDRDERRGQPVEVLFNRIEESRIALVIFSGKYTESKWCLMELAKIIECVEKHNMVAIPIFYKLDPSTVSGLRGQFGDAFRDLKERNETKEMWARALKSISNRVGIKVDKISDESKIIERIVEEVKRVLNRITLEESRNAYFDRSENSYTQTSSAGEKDKTFGIKQSLINGFKDNVNRDKITSHLGMIIGCLLVLFVIPKGPQQIAYMMRKRLIVEDTINRIVDNVPKFPEYISAEGTEDPRDTYTQRSSSDARTNADRTFTNSRMDSKVKPPQNQVFINFRGDQLRNNFVGFLVDALRRSEINVFIDNHAQRGEDLNTLFKRIEDSGIAIVVFSSRYTESNWCLKELVKIKERVQQGLLKVLPIFYNLPIFYKVTPTNVKRLKGEFGDHFRDQEYLYESDQAKIKQWKEAITFVSHKFALTLDENSNKLESDFVDTIVKEVFRMLQAISEVESGKSLVPRKPS